MQVWLVFLVSWQLEQSGSRLQIGRQAPMFHMGVFWSRPRLSNLSKEVPVSHGDAPSGDKQVWGFQRWLQDCCQLLDVILGHPSIFCFEALWLEQRDQSGLVAVPDVAGFQTLPGFLQLVTFRISHLKFAFREWMSEVPPVLSTATFGATATWTSVTPTAARSPTWEMWRRRMSLEEKRTDLSRSHKSPPSQDNLPLSDIAAHRSDVLTYFHLLIISIRISIKIITTTTTNLTRVTLVRISTFTSSPSSVASTNLVSSTITTASAPGGTGAPVLIRITWGGGSERTRRVKRKSQKLGWFCACVKNTKINPKSLGQLTTSPGARGAISGEAPALASPRT